MPKQTKQKAPAPKRRFHERVFESDSIYFLKLVAVFLLGTFWVKFAEPIEMGSFVLAAIPVGVLVGFLLVRVLERHQADRKLWYAILLVIGVISNFQAAGIVV